MKVALQTYSIREHMNADPIKTIKKAMDIGYKNFEVANHSNGVAYSSENVGIGFGIGPDEINEFLSSNNAHVIGAHVTPFPCEEEKLMPIFEYHHKIGTKYMTIPFYFYKGRDDVLRKIESLNKIGKIVTENGFVFSYHNHFHEWQKFGDETVMDMLLKNTDPNYVKFELDTVWATNGGCDPVEFIKQHGDRIVLIHQKDYNKEYQDRINYIVNVKEGEYIDLDSMLGKMPSQKAFVEIGTGCMDIQSIIDAANEYSKAEYFILEQDYTQLDEMESIEVSYKVFSTLKNLELS